MDNYNEDQAYRGGSAGALTPDAQEAKRLRNQLVEYDGYLQEMRKSNMKNVETLDRIRHKNTRYNSPFPLHFPNLLHREYTPFYLKSYAHQ